MILNIHGEQKYRNTSQLMRSIERPGLRVEHRRLEPGYHQPGVRESNELAFVVSGRSSALLTIDGATRQALIQPGSACIIPQGASESASANLSAVECLHIYLPPALIEQSAAENYGIDPAKSKLNFVSGVTDPMLNQIAMGFHGVLGRESEPTDRLFLDGMQAALAGYLLSNYTIDRWRAPATEPDLEVNRLKRVLEFIEAHFLEDISLDELACEACLSEFHFSRLFRKATGVSPGRFVTYRRVQEAQRRLEFEGTPLVQIALETGFGSQANFIRVFRKATGTTPGQYRAVRRS